MKRVIVVALALVVVSIAAVANAELGSIGGIGVNSVRPMEICTIGGVGVSCPTTK